MPFAPAGQQQALIGGVAHQRVLETEAPFQAALLGKDDPRRHQLRQRGFEFGARPGRDRVEQRKRELPADDGGDLRHFAGLAEAVEPGHQRILERRRHRAVFARRFHHALGQFLDEQRHAIGLGNDRGDGLRRQAVRGGDAGDQLRAFRAAQAAERQQRRMRPRLARAARNPAARSPMPAIAPGRCCRSAASSSRAWWRRSSARLPGPEAPDRSSPTRTNSSTSSASVAALRCAGVSDGGAPRRVRDRQQFGQ